jgi:hypothetical protein
MCYRYTVNTREGGSLLQCLTARREEGRKGRRSGEEVERERFPIKFSTTGLVFFLSICTNGFSIFNVLIYLQSPFCHYHWLLSCMEILSFL